MTSKNPSKEENNIRVQLHTAKKELNPELDLHGCNIEEGIDKVEHYLDKAYLYGISPVRLVHGHGTGKLRKAIRKYLESHPHVIRFGPAGLNQGGDGATMVHLDFHLMG